MPEIYWRRTREELFKRLRRTLLCLGVLTALYWSDHAVGLGRRLDPNGAVDPAAAAKICGKERLSSEVISVGRASVNRVSENVYELSGVALYDTWLGRVYTRYRCFLQEKMGEATCLRCVEEPKR